nr:MAG TPA: hypothetical protein [Caudoviricetes sp.]
MVFRKMIRRESLTITTYQKRVIKASSDILSVTTYHNQSYF